MLKAFFTGLRIATVIYLGIIGAAVIIIAIGAIVRAVR